MNISLAAVKTAQQIYKELYESLSLQVQGLASEIKNVCKLIAGTKEEFSQKKSRLDSLYQGQKSRITGLYNDLESVKYEEETLQKNEGVSLGLTEKISQLEEFCGALERNLNTIGEVGRYIGDNISKIEELKIEIDKCCDKLNTEIMTRLNILQRYEECIMEYASSMRFCL
ncbi:MAG: hypothetical protein ACI4MI_02870 [Christensenellales bacterium]